MLLNHWCVGNQSCLQGTCTLQNYTGVLFYPIWVTLKQTWKGKGGIDHYLLSFFSAKFIKKCNLLTWKKAKFDMQDGSGAFRVHFPVACEQYTLFWVCLQEVIELHLLLNSSCSSETLCRLTSSGATLVGWSKLKYHHILDELDASMMNPNDFVGSITFHLSSPASWHFWWVKCWRDCNQIWSFLEDEL